MTRYLGKKLERRLSRLANVCARGLLIGTNERREAWNLIAELRGFAEEVHQLEEAIRRSALDRGPGAGMVEPAGTPLLAPLDHPPLDAPWLKPEPGTLD